MRRILLFFALAVLAVPAPAVEVEGLYEAEVGVADQSQRERAEAMRRALGEVLVKVTGKRDVAGQVQAEEVLRRATEYAQQYHYSAAPADAAAPEPAAQLLWVRFDPTLVNQALQRVGLPIWGRSRPALLVWLALDFAGERVLVGRSEQPTWAEGLEAIARQRGLPLLVPLWDIEDRAAIGAGDIWGDFQEPVFRASMRYQPDAVLVGRVFATETGYWQGRWTLYKGADVNGLYFEDASPLDVVGQALHAIADALAAQYAQVFEEGVQQVLDLYVADVTSLEGYARTLRYLQSLEGVGQVQVVRAEPAGVLFRLTTRGRIDGLARVIALGSLLVPQAGTGQGADLAYRLVP